MAKYNEMSENFTLPMVPLMGAIFAFPNISITVDISNPVLKGAVEAAEKTDSFVYLVTQKNPFADKVEIENLFSVGTIARVKQVTKRGEKTILASFEGVCRAEHTSITRVDKAYMCAVMAKRLEITDYDIAEEDALLRVLGDKAKAAISLFASPSKDLLMQFGYINDIDFLSDLCGALILTRVEDKYAILAEYDKFKRTNLAIELMDKEIKVVKLESALKRKTSAKIDESQKEYFLREQLKVIQGELGNDSQSEGDELYEQILSKHFPKAVEEKLLKELAKFNKAPFGSPESAVLRTYIETCLEIPFEKYLQSGLPNMCLHWD